MKIIDIHIHNTLSHSELVAEAALRHNIGNIVLLGDVLRFGYYPDEEQISQLNSETIECVKKHPGFCYGFCFLNPANDCEFSLSEMERCIKQHGFIGVKLEVSLNCRNERLHPIMRKLEEYDVPLLHHSWYKTGGNLPQESSPADIAYLGAEFPKVKIIMAHLTGVGIKGILDIAPFENIYIDTSGGQPHSELVEFALEKLGPERIVYGSDAPIRDFSAQLGRIAGADISSSAKEMIMGKNAERILKI
ncbi:MAG: amidohydrolase family protein [Victivallales bacterium]